MMAASFGLNESRNAVASLISRWDKVWRLGAQDLRHRLSVLGPQACGDRSDVLRRRGSR
jgi:hypothetical protein